MLVATKEFEMSSLHSVLDNVAAAGNLYGWRLDAILLGGLFWAFATAISQLRSIA
jgi:hypothetical protein